MPHAAIPRRPRLRRAAIIGTAGLALLGSATSASTHDSFEKHAIADISGIYVSDYGHGCCSFLPPPPDVLELRLVGESEPPPSAYGAPLKRLHYEGSLTYNTSYTVRNDCPFEPHACQTPVAAHCELQSVVYSLTGATSWYRTPDFGSGSHVVRDRFSEDIVQGPFSGESAGSTPGLPYSSGIQLNFGSQHLEFGERVDEGEVTEIIATSSPLGGLVPGAKALCTISGCAIHPNGSPDPTYQCGGTPVFRRIAGASGRIQVTADVEGTARSSVPTLTETPFEVQQASVSIFRQSRFVEPRQEGETTAEFLERLRPALAERQDHVEVRRDDDGTYTFDSPGRFVFDDVPVFSLQLVAGKRIWAPQLYAIGIRGARTEEQAVDGGGDPIPGQTETLQFGDAYIVNVLPGDAELDVELELFFATGIKRTLVDSLSRMSLTNYLPIENLVLAYINDLDDMVIEQTDSRDEGVRRANWSERSVLQGTESARDLIDISVTGLATLLADLFDDFVTFQRADVARSESKLQQIEQTKSSIPQHVLDQYALDTEDIGGDEFKNLTKPARNARLIGHLKGVFKGVVTAVTNRLIEAGVDEEEARAKAGHVLLALNTMLGAAQNRTLLGAGKATIKTVIEAVVNAGKPLLYDGTSPLSYTKFTSEHLQFSRSSMMSWNASNRVAYLADRQAVVGLLSTHADEGSTILANAQQAQIIAQGLDASQDMLESLGSAVAWAKVLAKLAQVTKYVANASSIVRPAAFVYGRGEGLTEQAVYRSYGMSPPAPLLQPGLRAPAAIPAASSIEVPVLDDLVARLGDLESQLLENDIGAVLDTLSEPTDLGDEIAGVLEELAAYRLQRSAVAAATLPTATLDAIALAATSEAELELAVARSLERLRDLLAAIFTLEYPDSASADFVAHRNRTATGIRILAGAFQQHAGVLADLGFKTQFDALVPAIAASLVSVASTTTGFEEITQHSESFEVAVRLRNLSDTMLSQVGASLSVSSTSGSVAIVGPGELVVAGGTLAADDGSDGTGGDEAVLTWTIQYSGDLDWESVSLVVETLEDGQAPTSFVADAAEATLLVQAQLADSDLDGMPNDFEIAHDLDTEADDSGEDADADGLTNVVELRLGTDPRSDDTDEDGLTDYDEVAPGPGGSPTDPLDPDTDDDGLQDGEDPDPAAASAGAAEPATSAALAYDGEPIVAVGSETVILTAASPLALVPVTNAGAGTLEWTARTGDDAIATPTPALPDIRIGESMLSIAAPGSYDFGSTGGTRTVVTVSDTSGAVRDSKEIEVLVYGDIGQALCGHVASDSIFDEIKASDALFALRAAVGQVECELCRCDANDSGDVTASDALVLLRSAVGSPATLDCPACVL